MTDKKRFGKILLYHGIVAEGAQMPESREVGAELYDVSVDEFRAQLDWLNSDGYSVVTLQGSSAEITEKSILLTFDDGEINNYQAVLPVLLEYGFKACFFIIVKRVGRQGYMGWDELRKMHEAGMVIGSHGLSHEILTNLKETQIEEELSASKRTLERNLEIEIDTLSIPRGFCNNQIIQMAYQEGYKDVFISEKPSMLREQCFSRTAVKGSWPLKRFIQVFDEKTPMPVWERVFEMAKKTAKFIFRESGYNWLRNLIIQIFK